MASQYRVQPSEKYYCSFCNNFKKFQDINRIWNCPECGESLKIKIKIDDNFHSCQRITLDKLSVGELVTLENRYIHEVLAIQRYGSNYQLALKEYGIINLGYNEIITKVDGGWYMDKSEL